MLDYTCIIIARQDYEERAHALAHPPYMRHPKPGSAGGILAATGVLLIKAGGWLQAHGASMQVPPTSVPDTL